MASSLLERLDQTAADMRRAAWSAIARATAAAAVATATLLVLVDWLGRFHDPGLRWLFTASLIGVTTWVGRFAWRRLRPTNATRLGVAQRLQTLRPSLGSRLASAVEFAAGEADDPSAGSAELRRAVVLDATNAAGELPYGEAIDHQPKNTATRWLAAASGALIVFGLVAPSTVGSGLYRLAMPWADAPWPRSAQLEVTEAPELIARGTDFEATAINRLGPIPEDTSFEYRISLRGTSSAPAQLVGDRAVVTRERVDQPFAYRFRSEKDDTMPWHQVEVVEAPSATRFSVRLTPPAYSGLPATDSSGPLKVLAGTAVRLFGQADEPLLAATIVLPTEQTISLPIADLSVTRQSDHPERTTEFGGSDQPNWVAEPTEGTTFYEVRLTGPNGIDGVIGPHRYETIRDTPPKVAWSRSADDAVVPPGALVPIAARVIDDLATRSIELEWTSQQADQPEPLRLTLADRGETPPAKRSLDESDEQEVDTEWDLEPLGLKPGEVLEVILVATDYRPAEGRTPSPRRVVVVSEDEFLRRLSEKQSRLLGRLQQAIATQRSANLATTDLAAEAQSTNATDRQTLDRLTSVEFQQREATAAVDDPATGAAGIAQRLLTELRRSRVEAPDFDRRLSNAAAELGRLAQETLPAARGELASARRAGDRGASDELRQRLDDAQRHQQEAVDRLEGVAELLTDWADFQRFTAEVAELEKLQRESAAESRKAAAEAAAGLSGLSQTDRAKRITRQAEANRRFEKLRRAMRRLLENSPEGDEPSRAAESIRDALAEADEADVPGSLRRAGSDLARNRDGAASRSQDRAAAGLRQMLETLRRRTTTDPAELITRLEEEKVRLAELQKMAEQLREAPDTRPNRSARQRAAERAERQSRRLERLTAQRAAESTQRGADRAAEQGPDPRRQMAEASDQFRQAERDVDRRIRELQNELTQRLLDQLAEKIDGYLERQGAVLDGTLDLQNQAERGDSIEPLARPLALDQRDLSDEVEGFADKLASRAVFELALRQAATSSGEAAGRLAQSQVGRKTQRLETAALARLKQIQEVLQQNQQDQENQQQGGGGGGAGEQQPPSLIDVAELKMLRLMQLELLGETDTYEADTAQARRDGAPLPQGWGALGQELANRQKRLIELALELANRDNGRGANPSN